MMQGRGDQKQKNSPKTYFKTTLTKSPESSSLIVDFFILHISVSSSLIVDFFILSPIWEDGDQKPKF